VLPTLERRQIVLYKVGLVERLTRTKTVLIEAVDEEAIEELAQREDNWKETLLVGEPELVEVEVEEVECLTEDFVENGD
jgi:hypothetical protein